MGAAGSAARGGAPGRAGGPGLGLGFLSFFSGASCAESTPRCPTQYPPTCGRSAFFSPFQVPLFERDELVPCEKRSLGELSSRAARKSAGTPLAASVGGHEAARSFNLLFPEDSAIFPASRPKK